MTRPLVASMLPVALGVAVLASAQARPGEPAAGVGRPAGLDAFLAARVLEVDGSYQLAIEKYAEALEASPEIDEIRICYAALLLEGGLAEKAVTILDGARELDWYGRRTEALALAQLAMRDQERVPAAEAALREVLEVRADDLNVALRLAHVLQRAGRLGEAEEIVAELLGQRGRSERLIAYDASLLRALGRGEEAARLYRRCVDGPSTSDACREGLVEVLADLGRSAEAGEALLGWSDDADLDQLLRAAALLGDGGRPDSALKVVRRVLAAAPDSPPAQRLEAELLARLGHYREAAAKLRTLLRRSREDLDLLLTLAWVEAQAGSLDDARKAVDRAWAESGADPASPRAVATCLAAARIELAGGSPARAREWLERIADPDQGGADLVRLLAESYRRDRRYADGMAAMLRLQPRLHGRARTEAVAFEAEMRLRGGDVRGLRRLRALLESADASEVTLAVQVLQATERYGDVDLETAAALERFPGRRDLRFARAAALERLGRRDEAVAIFEGLLEEAPHDAASANYLGYMWADAGERLDDALRLVGVALEVEPGNPAYLDSLGWVHFRLGDLDQAKHWLEQAVERGGGDGTVYAHLGEVLLELGEREQGTFYLRRALELGCEHPEDVRRLLADTQDE